MARNIIQHFQVKYKTWIALATYEIEEKKGKYIIHRPGVEYDVAQIQSLTELSIRSALENSRSVKEPIVEIRF